MQTGRFETTDPVLGDIFNPGTLHRYVYAEGDPVNLIDPRGEDAIDEYAELLGNAEERYAKKVGRCEAHHIIPKYLGGDPGGPLAIIPGPYHQLITNAFRAAYPYGLG